MLNALYTVMDYVTSLFNVRKIETVGDAYMVAAGLDPPTSSYDTDSSTAEEIVAFALVVQEAVKVRKRNYNYHTFNTF